MAELYCTWSHRSSLSTPLKDQFSDLDYFLTELIASAKSRLVMMAPYLSPTGMSRLQGAIALAAQRGAWIRLVTTDINDANSWNRRAIATLIEGSEGAFIRRRIRILGGSDEFPAFVHAKVIVADGARAYLGSANLSSGGLDRNFELGVSLMPDQAASLERLIDFFEAQGFLLDMTERIVD